MADTIRKLIVIAIKQAFDNYSFTALSGATIAIGKTAFDESQESMPVISIIPNVEASAATEYGALTNEFLITISAAAAIGDNDMGLLAEDIVGELIHATGTTDLSGIDIIEVRYSGGGVDQFPENFDMPYLVANIDLLVSYETINGNPYAQP
jgi:hypothetical protein